MVSRKADEDLETRRFSMSRSGPVCSEFTDAPEEDFDTVDEGDVRVDEIFDDGFLAFLTVSGGGFSSSVTDLANDGRGFLEESLSTDLVDLRGRGLEEVPAVDSLCSCFVP